MPAMASDLKHFAHPRDAELFLVEFVQDDGVRRLQIFDPALDQVPRPFHGVVDIDPDNLDRVFAAVVPFPLRPVRHQLLCVSDAGHGSDLIELALAESDSLLHVGHIL